MSKWVRFEGRDALDPSKPTVDQGHRLEDIKAVRAYESGVVILFYNGAVEYTESYDVDGFFQNVLSA